MIRKILAWFRPMEYEGIAFVDAVSGETVNYYRDAFGRRWCKTHKFSWFKSPATECPPIDLDVPRGIM